MRVIFHLAGAKEEGEDLLRNLYLLSTLHIVNVNSRITEKVTVSYRGAGKHLGSSKTGQ
jgi:hypothetical protein